MRVQAILGLAVAFAVCAATSRAAELESGLQVGDRIGAFQAVKCGGAEDGVEVGKQLCYT